MKLTLTDLHLPMRHPFTITHGTTTAQHNLLVTLEDAGHTGYGEGAASKAYAHFNADAMRSALEGARSVIEAATFEHPEELWHEVFPLLKHQRAALCALDEAAHDLWGRRHGQPVWKLWGLELDRIPASDYTIGIDSVERMVAKMNEFPNWPIYKIKLGTDRDLEIIRELRRHTQAGFRIDANTAWTAERTLSFAPELKSLGVEFIEQPLKPDDWAGMKRIMAQCALPVIADESCQVEEDVAKCVGHFHGINVKLTKAGGLTPARSMISEARRLGLRVMAGCMSESSVGISAIAQLLPLLDYVDMDGALLIARDIAQGVRLECGRAIFPTTPGLGITLAEHLRNPN